jgi:HAD superfamily hydrolase (TIGR01549 family)
MVIWRHPDDLFGAPMIKAVFLDFYGTLVHWTPEMEAIQVAACTDEGLQVSEEAVARAYPTANAFMAAENSKSSVWSLPEPERKSFFAEYERLLLEAAGVRVSPEVAWRVWERVHSAPKELALYADVLPMLQELQARGLTRGVISNMGSQLTDHLEQLGLVGHIDVWATSAEAGVNKPHARIFQTALARAVVEPHEALHVGDDYDSDVLGARNAKMHALLLARDRDAETPQDSPVLRSLREILPFLEQQGHLTSP